MLGKHSIDLTIPPKLSRHLLGEQLDTNIAIKISATSQNILITSSLFSKPVIMSDESRNTHNTQWLKVINGAGDPMEAGLGSLVSISFLISFLSPQVQGVGGPELPIATVWGHMGNVLSTAAKPFDMASHGQRPQALAKWTLLARSWRAKGWKIPSPVSAVPGVTVQNAAFFEEE